MQRLGPCYDGVGQWSIQRGVGQILLTGEEPHKRPAPLRAVVADGATQHRIAGFEGIEDRALRHGAFDMELHLALNARQCPQMGRQHNADHGSVWTSTDNTGGRSRTRGVQLSPALAEP